MQILIKGGYTSILHVVWLECCEKKKTIDFVSDNNI